MGEPGKDHMFQLVGLSRDCFGNFRVSMPVNIHPPTGNQIQNLSPILGIKIRPPPGNDSHQIGHRLMLCIGSPNG